MDNKPLTYTSYLRLDDLLTLQQPRSSGPEHDEMLFIVVHQVYELWFSRYCTRPGTCAKPFMQVTA